MMNKVKNILNITVLKIIDYFVKNLRGYSSSLHLKKIVNKGENIKFNPGFTVFHGYKNIFLGSNINLADTLINAGDRKGKIVIEDYVFFGHSVQLLARSHDYKEVNSKRQNIAPEKPIIIKNGAWIASGAIIIGGVTIGKHSVVGAGSVVTKDVPDKTIVAGNPAKFKRSI